MAAAEVAEEQASVDLAEFILETAQQVDRFALASSAPGGCHAHIHSVYMLSPCILSFDHAFSQSVTLYPVFVHSIVHAFVHAFVHSFIHSVMFSFIPSFMPFLNMRLPFDVRYVWS